MLLDVLWKMLEVKRGKILSSLVAGVFDRHHLGDTIKGGRQLLGAAKKKPR